MQKLLFFILLSLHLYGESSVNEFSYAKLLDGRDSAYQDLTANQTQKLEKEHFQELHKAISSHSLHTLQKALVESSNLFDYQKLLFLEGGVGLFTSLKNAHLKESSLLESALLACLSSTSISEKDYLDFDIISSACRVLLDPRKTERDALDALLKKRGEAVGISPDTPDGRVLIRLSAMMGCYKKEDGKLLLDAFNLLSIKDRELALLQLDPRSMRREKLLPHGASELLATLMNNLVLGEPREERIKKAVQIGVPLLSKILHTHEQHLAKGTARPDLPLHFDILLKTASSRAMDLTSATYQIDPSGNISLDFAIQL